MMQTAGIILQGMTSIRAARPSGQFEVYKMSIIGDLRGLAKAGQDVLSAKTRLLTASEIAEAQAVFRDTIDYTKVLIADKLGLGNRPFTLVSGGPPDVYTLFMGPNVFATTSSSQWPTFIHEMTHVWQGQNYFISSAPSRSN
jgi:hypothetical protein